MIQAHSGHRPFTVAFRAALAIGVAILLAAVVLLFAYHPWNTGGSAPSAFGPATIQRTSPGSIGCRSTPAEVCYISTFDSSISNLPASNLFFAVSNHYPVSYPVSSSVPLGIGASVALLNSTHVAGVWNFTLGSWTLMPQGNLPTTSAIAVVLDTGLSSNSTLIGSYFYVEHSMPYGGAIGSPLS